MTRLLAAVASLLIAFPALPALGSTVKEITRLKGQGESILRGYGLVIGLSGTGDSGKDATLARPLFELLKANGNEPGSIQELVSTKSVAQVIVTCVVPAEGARTDDTLDVSIATVGNASSLRNGRLFLVPLRGPYAGDPVYAVAEGAIEVEGDASAPATVGRVRNGARMVSDILMPEVGHTFDLIIQPHFAGWAAAAQVATAIDAKAQPQGPSVAYAIDERTVRVTIPPSERQNKAAFLADVLGAEVNNALMDLPAQVIVNPKRGSIIITGDVEISPVAITHKNLTITTTVPPQVPTAANPRVKREKWTDLTTSDKASDRTKLADLIEALGKLDIPVEDQISILHQLHKTGKLHAKLIVD